MDLNANHDAEIYTVAAVFLSLTVVAVLLRLLSARLRKAPPGVDDYFILAALAVTIAETVAICVGVRLWGIGRHTSTLTQKQFDSYSKLGYAVTLLQPTALTLTKAAILALYYRVFTTRNFRIVVYVNGTFLLLWWICFTLTDAFICLSVDASWRPREKCNESRVPLIIASATWIATDVFILLMPVPLAWHLQLPRSQKVALIGVFLLGGFACISSAVRFSTVFFSKNDPSWTATDLFVWTIIESCITIISACLIVMKPVFIRFFPQKLRGKTRKKSVQSDDHQKKDIVPKKLSGSARSEDWPTVGSTAAPKGSFNDRDDLEWYQPNLEDGTVPLCKFVTKDNEDV